MDPEFCEHLADYQLMYESAAVSYQMCVDHMDKVLEGGPEPSLLNDLKKDLDLWEMETRELRDRFVTLTDRGEVLLPKEDQNTSAVCAHCGAEVPRLAFPEFEFQEDGTVHFRSQEIYSEEPVPV